VRHGAERSRLRDEPRRRHGCPRRQRGGHARRRPTARLCLLSSASARDSLRPRKWNAVAQALACGSWLAGPRRGNASQDRRNRHRLVPASSGATAPLACEDRRLVGCARASFYGCRSRRATPRPTRSAARWQRTRERGSSSSGPERARSSQRSSTAGIAVATPRRRSRPEPGARKGVAGRRLSLDGRHLGSFSKRHRSRERDGGDLGGPHDGTFARERGVRREGGDRGARGTACTHRHGKTTPAAMAPLEERAARRSESH
jgi:hypothetical protein